ncbi:MAG: ABC transporter permease [Puniceicoccaceae bacterium]|nr:MAG: ABC transporter permease [Puniceicoccaceae bacterium]
MNAPAEDRLFGWKGRGLRLGLGVNAALVYGFLYLPVVVLMVFSFSGSRYATVWGGFSVQWYVRLLDNQVLLSALRTTLVLAVCATLLATVLGTMAAFGLRRLRGRLRGLLETWFFLPVLVPDLVLAIALLMFFVLVAQLQLGLGTLIIAHSVFCTAYVAAVVGARLKGFDDRLEEAALDLGATRWQVFTRIKLPLVWPGILGGALLSLALSLDEFVISFFVTGPGATTLPIEIYSMVKRGVTPEINALATLMLLASIVLATLSILIQSKNSS